MYGGPRRPTRPYFEGQLASPPQNCRPRFIDPRFPPPFQSYHPQFNEDTSGFHPSGRFANPHPGVERGSFRPRSWQAAGLRQEFRPRRTPGHWGGGHGDVQRVSSGIEAYYRHSMVENPWQELEEKFKEENQNS